MGQKVERIIEVQNEYVDKLKDMDRKKSRIFINGIT